jgi:hypothetical protein
VRKDGESVNNNDNTRRNDVKVRLFLSSHEEQLKAARVNYWPALIRDV